MSKRVLAEPRLADDAADLPKGKPVRIKRLPTDRIEPATPEPIKRATSGDMYVRQTAEDRGHRFETWGDLGIEPRTVGGRCQNCRRWAMVSYEVPENYTEAQAVMRYKGDAFNLPCQDRP
jgi:hypothetical protein